VVQQVFPPEVPRRPDAGVQAWYLPSPDDRTVVAHLEPMAHIRGGACKGELPPFVSHVEGRTSDGDLVAYRIPLDVETIWNEDFATVLSATVSIDDREVIADVRLGIGDEKGLAYECTCPRVGHEFFGVGGWRFQSRPAGPYLQIKIVLKRATALLKVMVM